MGVSIPICIISFTTKTTVNLVSAAKWLIISGYHVVTTKIRFKKKKVL